MKLFFIKYLETRNQLTISTSPFLVMKLSVNEGVNISRSSGHKRKRDAMARIEQVNKAAGKEIAVFHGSVNV